MRSRQSSWPTPWPTRPRRPRPSRRGRPRSRASSARSPRSRSWRPAPAPWLRRRTDWPSSPRRRRWPTRPAPGRARATTSASTRPMRSAAFGFAASRPHPSPLVESGPMASVAPPAPTYRPVLPVRITDDALVSDAQMETVIYAGEAHAQVLPGSWILGDAPHQVILVKDDHPGAVQIPQGLLPRRRHRLRQGPGDRRRHRRQPGPGPVARGVAVEERRPAGGRPARLDAPSAARPATSPRNRPGSRPTPSAWIGASCITTYATLRQPARGDRRSRLDQIVDLAGGGLRRGDRLRRGACDGQRRRRRQGRARDQEGLAAGHGRAGAAEPPAQRPDPLRLGDRRHDAGEPGLCRAAGPLGRAGSPLPHPRRLHGCGRDRRRGGDGADRARAEGHGPLHRPLAVVRRRRVRGPASSAHGRRHRASGTPGPTPTS